MSNASLKRGETRTIVNVDEPSTSKNKKTKNLQAGTFLKNKHPELFEILPRRGGFRRHGTTHRDVFHSTANSDVSTAEISPPPTREELPREYANISEVLETTIRCPSTKFVSKDDRSNILVKIYSIAISTVMMLAQRSYEDITTEHVSLTEEYFRSLRQPDGYPENVKQLLQLLTALKESGKLMRSATEAEQTDEETIKEEKGSDEDYETQMSDSLP